MGRIGGESSLSLVPVEKDAEAGALTSLPWPGSTRIWAMRTTPFHYSNN
jgi:hypothetical protein